MKIAVRVATLASCMVHSPAVRMVGAPMEMVVGLIEGLEKRIQDDGMAEQTSYDKFACWCEDTLARKANDITTAKDTITKSGQEIEELKAQIATHLGEIEGIKKDIAQNVESQREATEIRNKEKMEYNDKKAETEQCIGGLEMAIGVLAGAGTKKDGFLETLQEAKLLSVAAGIRSIITKSPDAASPENMRIVHHFTEHPEQFVNGVEGEQSALQIANNPFGDYAPQSSQIQGILKSMYESFTGNLEKLNVEEATAQKGFLKLMGTKKAELATLEKTMETHELDKATKNKELAETTELKDDTVAQLKADTELFETTKSSCGAKAKEWAERVRLRTEELMAVRHAINVLSSDHAKATFENATSNFLQLSSARDSTNVITHMQSIAREHHSLGLSKLVALLKEGGHFDQVIASIDKMIAMLRQEEMDDVAHRDRCQGSQNKNKNDKEDLESEVEKTGKKLERMGDQKTNKEADLETLEQEINTTKEEMADALKLRVEERKAFAQSIKDDTEAIRLLNEAIASMKSFYKRNKMAPLALEQQAEAEPEAEYTEDPDKPPSTSWGGAYKGSTGESGGIVAILKMLVEDLQKEMQTAKKNEAEAQADYRKTKKASDKTLEKQEESKAAMEKELTDLDKKIFAAEEHKTQKEDELDGEKDMEKAIEGDCAWVETHFDSRREARKAEIDGLNEAKGYLAGVESGTELAP